MNPEHTIRAVLGSLHQPTIRTREGIQRSFTERVRPLLCPLQPSPARSVGCW